MSQHLYECERCQKYGVAHYILVPDETAPLGWRNELVCTKCWKAHHAEGRAA
jgi:hypothetical protein